MLFGEKILLDTTTEFERYQVIEMIYEGRKARVLFSGNRDAAFSGIPLDDNHDLLFDYIQRMYEFICNIRPRAMLLIGGGTFTLPTALLQTLPDITIDAVEIDPKLEVIAQEFFNLTPNKRLNIIHDDGKHFLEYTTKKYDLIIVDAFSNLTIPRSISEPSFTELANKHLTSNGLIAMNIISSFYGKRSQNIEYFYRLYDRIFAKTSAYPASHGSSPVQSQNFILVGQRNTDNLDGYMRYSPMPKIDDKRTS